MKDQAYVFFNDAYLSVLDYIPKNEKVLLLYDSSVEDTVFEFDNIYDLIYVLNETYPRTFYITNKSLSYLFIYVPDSRYFTAAGAAGVWLAERLKDPEFIEKYLSE